jgi:SAM-dependent methyltransferase
MSIDREQIIKEQFTEISLTPKNMALYSVRTSVLCAVKNALPFFRGEVLDVGCGIMPYKSLILKNKSVNRYIGMDLRQTDYHGKVPPDLYWDGINIPLTDNSINTVMATEFLEHYHSTNNVLVEINRVMAPGGILFGTVPFIWNLHEIPFDEYRFTPYSLRRHLEKSGFYKIEIVPLGGANRAMAQMLGLWFPLVSFKGKKILKWGFYHFFKWLIRRDKIFTEFDNHRNSLFSGLSFIAYKHE